MMEENKSKSNKVFYVLIGLLILIFVYAQLNNYFENKNWKEEWSCSSVDAARDFGDSKNCLLENCKPVPNKFNTQINQCTCPITNKTVYTYCSHGIRSRIYEGDINEITNFVNRIDAADSN